VAVKTYDSDWVYVQSSNVWRIRYVGPPESKLYVDFHGGGGGYYSGVFRDVFARMLQASSKGKFVHKVLKANYRWTAT
jgi:hypothetical protein